MEDQGREENMRVKVNEVRSVRKGVRFEWKKEQVGDGEEMRVKVNEVR